MENEEATLLGSPIGGVSAISTTLREKVDALKIMGGRLAHLATHDALLLVKHSFALPKLLHCLRTAPCFLSPGLQEYDNHLKVIVSEITNIHFPYESPCWSQATLPVRLGGLGIRSAVQVAPSVFGLNRCLHGPCAPHCGRHVFVMFPFPIVMKQRHIGQRDTATHPLRGKPGHTRSPGTVSQ